MSQNTRPPETEIARLIAFMAERELDYKDLARQMHWSPTVIFGALGGAWSLTDSFRWTFAKTFGYNLAGQIFDNKSNGHDATPDCTLAPLEALQ